MTKSTCFLALFVAVVVCTEAIRIDTSEPASSTDQHIKKNDARCRGKTNGHYPFPGDCKRYLKCVRGHSRVMECPGDLEFDSIRHCIYPGEKPDCGNPINRDIKCKESWGIFPLESDCHKYIMCKEGIPEMKNCPPKMHFEDVNGSCINGDECP